MIVNVLAGDFGKYYGRLGATAKFDRGCFYLRGVAPGSDRLEKISADDIELVESIDSENAKSVLGAVGLGVAGAAVFGGAGAIVGGLLGGSSRKITFVCKLKDGRKFLAQTKSKTWLKIQAATF